VSQPRSSRFWTLMSAGTVAAMLAMSYAAVPLYNLFCKATGYRGTTGVAVVRPTAVLDRPIEVRFDTNTAPGVPLQFTADQPVRSLKLGETALVFFHVRNIGPDPIQAVATYNVSPEKVGIYFRKLECFCFEPKVFKPGESLELPVVFFVDARLAGDKNTKEVEQIALSYTYFIDPKAKPFKTADASAPPGGPGRVVARP
jgi:cytochrome c oxidase assembly protein subunit 11